MKPVTSITIIRENDHNNTLNNIQCHFVRNIHSCIL